MRYLISFIIAAFVTLALFLGMQSLIQSGDGQLSEPAKGNVLDFVRLKKEQVVEKKQRKPQKPPKPKEPPPPMEAPKVSNSKAQAQTSSFDFGANIDADVNLGSGLSLGSGDGEYLPIVKVSPVYPRRALSRGIEGYVIVEFTVTKNGTVIAPVVVNAKPEGLFDRAAMDAVLKFKYKPRVVDGEAVAVAGVQNKISFEISG